MSVYCLVKRRWNIYEAAAVLIVCILCHGAENFGQAGEWHNRLDQVIRSLNWDNNSIIDIDSSLRKGPFGDKKVEHSGSIESYNWVSVHIVFV